MRIQDWPKKAAIALTHGWRLFPGRLLPPLCRYHPSCSHYMLRALNRHGLVKGGFLGVKRLCRCHPWSEGGFDPVPGEEEESRAAYEEALRRSSGF